jgi:hypothetical protein
MNTPTTPNLSDLVLQDPETGDTFHSLSEIMSFWQEDPSAEVHIYLEESFVGSVLWHWDDKRFISWLYRPGELGSHQTLGGVVGYLLERREMALRGPHKT